jgi:DNA polymerase-3 subunit delta
MKKMEKIIIYGDSNIRMEMALKSFYDDELENIKISPSSQNALNEIKNNLLSNSLFGNKKIVIIKDFNKFKKKEQEEILNIIKDTQSDNVIKIIIISNSKIKFKFDKEIQCMLPKPWEEDKWIEYIKEISNFFNKDIEDDAIRYILDVYGTNDNYLFEEIKKFSIYSNNDTITKNDIEEIGFAYINMDFEEFSYLLSSKRKEEVLEIAKKYLSDANFNIIFLLGYLFKYFFDLYRVIISIEQKKKYSWPEVQRISQITSVSKLRVKKFLGVKFKNEKRFYANHAMLYSKMDIMDIIIKIEEFDRMVKKGEKKEIILYSLIENICG